MTDTNLTAGSQNLFDRIAGQRDFSLDFADLTVPAALLDLEPADKGHLMDLKKKGLVATEQEASNSRAGEWDTFCWLTDAGEAHLASRAADEAAPFDAEKTFRSFDSSDYDAWAGAEDFTTGDAPIIGEVRCDDAFGGMGGLLIVAGGNGFSLLPDGVDHGGWYIPVRGPGLRSAAQARTIIEDMMLDVTGRARWDRVNSTFNLVHLD